MSQLVVLRIVIGGASAPPPTGAHPVVVPNPVTITPGVPTTVEVKMDDGTGALTPLLPSQFLVAFWGSASLGITAQAAGHTVILTAPAGLAAGATADLSIDVRP